MKPTKHRFIVTVKNGGTKKSAKYSLLAAFAKRQPDGCEFRVFEPRKAK